MLTVLLFSVLMVIVNGAFPDCGIRNQFREHCVKFDYCNEFGCQSTICGGWWPRNSELLRIHQTNIIPKCAVINSSSVKYIIGINSNIRVLASGAFAHLKNVESIYLSLNLLRELHYAIFYNVSVNTLDLSWNKIIYISEGAFYGVIGLKHLNLSRNELTTLPFDYLPRSIEELNLAYNFLEWLALNGAKRPNLTSVDLSYNKLYRVAFSFDNRVKKLDLSNNNLTAIDFYDINDCEVLKIPSNMFTDAPYFLQYSRIKRISLHPNPWKCEELERLWTSLQSNNIEEVQPNRTESQPLCTIDSGLLRLQAFIDSNDLECEDDRHCASNLLCRAHKCWDPCPKTCHSSNICTVEDHKVGCTCPGTQKKNPREVFSSCNDVECFFHKDCKNNSLICTNNTCKENRYGSGYGGGSSGSLAWWYMEIPKVDPVYVISKN